jgi:aminoglycoside phosphotransferase (APT) family kinase protein
MSTIGHPLSDVTNFLTQFYLAKSPAASQQNVNGFLPGQTPGMPQPAQILEWYSKEAGYDPHAELNWGMAFNIFRLAGVCQGIAARYALRQASSEKAKAYSVTRIPLAEFAWQLAQVASKGGSPKL